MRYPCVVKGSYIHSSLLPSKIYPNGGALVLFPLDTLANIQFAGMFARNRLYMHVPNTEIIDKFKESVIINASKLNIYGYLINIKITNGIFITVKYDDTVNEPQIMITTEYTEIDKPQTNTINHIKIKPIEGYEHIWESLRVATIIKDNPIAKRLF